MLAETIRFPSYFDGSPAFISNYVRSTSLLYLSLLHMAFNAILSQQCYYLELIPREHRGSCPDCLGLSQSSGCLLRSLTVAPQRDETTC